MEENDIRLRGCAGGRKERVSADFANEGVRPDDAWSVQAGKNDFGQLRRRVCTYVLLCGAVFAGVTDIWTSRRLIGYRCSDKSLLIGLINGVSAG